jgi:hypothetical protein
VDVYYGEVPVEGVSENREYDNGPIDTKLRVLKFMRGGKLQGFIVNFSVHNVVLSEETHMYSADLTGGGIAKVIRENPGAVGIFLQGSCGDINPRPARELNFQPPEKCLKLLGELTDLFAGYVRQALKGASPLEVKRLDMETKAISLPQVPSDKALVLRNMQLADKLLMNPNLPPDAQGDVRFSRDSARAIFDRYNRLPLDERETEIQALRIQDVLILTHGGELFVAFLNQLVGMLPNWKVWAVGYANDWIGYIPTPDRYDVNQEKFSYPAYFVPMIGGEFRYREDIGDVLVHQLVAFAHEITAP